MSDGFRTAVWYDLKVDWLVATASAVAIVAVGSMVGEPPAVGDPALGLPSTVGEPVAAVGEPTAVVGVSATEADGVTSPVGDASGEAGLAVAVCTADVADAAAV
jgi:hypothetical protein